MRCFPACLPSLFFSKGSCPVPLPIPNFLARSLTWNISSAHANQLVTTEREREREIWHGAPGYDFRLGKQKCVFPTKRTVHNNKTHLGPTRRGLTWAQLNFHILSHSSFVFLSFLRVRVPKYTKNKTNKTKLTVYDTICCASNCEFNSEKRKKTEVSNGCQLSLLLDFGPEREGERQRERG